MEKLRSYWFCRQGLDESLSSLDSAAILERTGWARSVGGSNPYLQLFARNAASRESVDHDIDQVNLHELPSARGCTYVLPRAHFAIGLLCGQGFNDAPPIAMAKKHLGVTDEELGKLDDAILAALRGGPLDPKGLRDAVGDAVRNLGQEGKKRGQTNTLSLSLGSLQSAGRIRRIPANGRLDQQRFQYELWEDSPLKKSTISREEAHVELAKLYWTWIGVASLAQFRWFSGLGASAAKAALLGLNLVSLEGDYLIPETQLNDYQAFEPSNEPQIKLVSSIDGHLLLRRDVQSLIADEDKNFQVRRDRAFVSVGGIQDLSSHAILDRGRIIGVWEFDVDAGEIAWVTFRKPPVEVYSAVKKTETFIREQLGDARSFSLDSPESRRPQIEAIRLAASA